MGDDNAYKRKFFSHLNASPYIFLQLNQYQEGIWW